MGEVMSKQWVQHISGQGEKWEVMTDNGHQWGLHHNVNSIGWHFVPKSEYRLCEPPEVWEDVTEQCEITPTGLVRIINSDKTHTYLMKDNGYRFRKVSVFAFARPIIDPAQREMCAFVVEKRKA